MISIREALIHFHGFNIDLTTAVFEITWTIIKEISTNRKFGVNYTLFKAEYSSTLRENVLPYLPKP